MQSSRSIRAFCALALILSSACGEAPIRDDVDADGYDAGDVDSDSDGASTGGGLASGGAWGSGGYVAGTGGYLTAVGGTFGTGGDDVGTGGASTGGASTGGASTGGVSTGGVSTGGASTGGASTGGSSTGGSSTGGSGTGGSSCTTPPAASALVGWAASSKYGVATTTGGGSATPQTVTTLAQLQSAVSGTTAKVIYVKGVLAAGDINVGSNKTIVGLCDAEIHGHLHLSSSVNVIIRNLEIVGYGVGNCALDPDYDSGEGCSSGQDAISLVNESHHVWFDHCLVRDGTDGNLDITNGSDYVTVSWSRFTYTPRTDNQGGDSTGAAGHRFSNLIGGTDNPSHDDANSLNVTWHHNHWDEGVVERMPRVRFGRNHLFNNLFDSSVANYCIRAGKGARVLLENNYFDGVKDAHEFNNSTDQKTAYISASGNTYVGTSGEKATGGGGTAWTKPEYSYTLTTPAAARTAILASVGPQ